MSEQATKKKHNLLYLHVIITVLLMFGFGKIPPFGAITPFGMQMLGVFLGLIYA